MDNAEDNDLDAMFARANAREKRLVQRLEESAITDVFGVVFAKPGGMRAGEPSWTFLARLRPWQRAGHSMHDSELVVRKYVDRDELRTLTDTLKQYSVVRLRLRISEECIGGDTWDQPQALLIEIVDADANEPELRRISDDFKIPKFFRDDYFGKLKLDREFNQLEGTRRRGFSKYRVCIERVGETYDAKQAWERVLALEAGMPSVHEAIVKELCDIYNATWQSLGTLTPARFLKKIKLSSVNLSSDGTSTACFDDGGLFLGHDIEVRIDENGEVQWADLSG